jgi:hypothetical protein
LLLAAPSPAEISQLWGNDGERWNAASRLPDFSHAGYGQGAATIPSLAVAANVRDFGAVGDGRADDSAAFLAAIAATAKGAIFIPSGRYLLNRQLKISKSNVVLRGENRDTTILLFQKTLSDLLGASTEWSASGGLVYFQGYDDGGEITSVSLPAHRGDVSLQVASASGLTVGQSVRLCMTNTDGTLARHLYADQLDGATELLGLTLVDFPLRITAIQGNLISFNRPLRLDVRLTWTPALFSQAPSVHDVGIEDVTIQFPEVVYPGHHNEPGSNAVAFEGITNGWARRLKIVNADSGIFLSERTRFSTVDSIEFDAGPARLRTGYGGPGENATMPVAGHHALLAIGLAQDNLFSDFTLRVRFVHDTAVSAYAVGNVFEGGTGVDMSFDHHRRAPYENLFTQIDVGQGSRLWESGGDDSDGPEGGARETFWNIQSVQNQKLPPWAVEVNAVGITSQTPTQTSATGNWWELITPSALTPPNLYAAQTHAAVPQPTGSTSESRSDALSVHVFPNPWREDREPHLPIVFDQLTGHCTIKIFTLSGHWIRTLESANGSASWDRTNSHGHLVGSGIYLYLISNDQNQNAKGKLAIIR